MARIAGVDLPRDKRLDIALRYIYGIGPTRAYMIVQGAEVDPSTKVRDTLLSGVHSRPIAPRSNACIMCGARCTSRPTCGSMQAASLSTRSSNN